MSASTSPKVSPNTFVQSLRLLGVWFNSKRSATWVSEMKSIHDKAFGPRLEGRDPRENGLIAMFVRLRREYSW